MFTRSHEAIYTIAHTYPLTHEFISTYANTLTHPHALTYTHSQIDCVCMHVCMYVTGQI